MAIGDPVEHGKGRTDAWVRRFDAPDGIKALEGDLLKSAVFEADFPRSWLQTLWRAARLHFRRGDYGLRLRPGRFGILALADRVNDVFRVGIGSTGVAVEVPYPHLAMLAGIPQSRDPDDIADDLYASLSARWRPYLDPIVGLRVAVFRETERADGQLALFVGRGVFLPNRGEQPVGTVEIALADGSGAWTEPRLPDGRPAGIYRGQTSLAIADRSERAPATCSLLADPRHLFVLQFERSGSWRRERESGGVCLTAVPIGPIQASDARPDPRGIEPPEGYDAAFEIWRDGAKHLNVRVICDHRRSALRAGRRPCERETLEVLGILAPDRRSFGRQIDRWWIDLDANGLLVSTAFATVAKSIIVAERSFETYEWRTNRFRIGSEPAFGLQECEVGGHSRTLVRRLDRRPLGNLLPPLIRCGIAFDNTGSSDLYRLDWLDFAGAVEPIFGETVRLAEALGSSIVDPFALQVPSVDEVAQMEPGREFFVGPLLVRVGERLQG